MYGNIQTINYYPAIGRNRVLIHATPRMTLENIMLSEMSQKQNDKYCVIPLK